MSNLLTLSYGDHPEQMEATLRILMEAGAVFEIETVQLGGEMKKLGFDKGFDNDVLKKIRCSHVLWMGINPDFDVKYLCEVFDLDNSAQIFGDGDDAALQYSNADYAIFMPVAANMTATLNSAIILLKHQNQLEIAERIEKAMADIKNAEPEEFAEKVINKLY